MAGQPGPPRDDQPSPATTSNAAPEAAPSSVPASGGVSADGTSGPPASSAAERGPSQTAGGPDSIVGVQHHPEPSSAAAPPQLLSRAEQRHTGQPAVDPAEQPERDVTGASPAAAPPVMPPGHRPLADLGARLLFEKVMTSCDVNGHGRIVVPKLAAATAMPVLDEGNGFTLEIDAVDTCGARHALAYRSCANGARGRIWLLENLREVQAKYGIALGDVLVVSQLPNGIICLSGRPGRAGDAARKPPRKGVLNQKKKRKAYNASAAADASSSDSEATEGSFFEPLRDGVYHAVPGGPRGAKARSGPPRVVEMNGTWTAVIDLAGEAYQAFFKNVDSARESFNAATQHLDLAP